MSEDWNCEHGVSMDDECVACEVMGDLAHLAGATTPREIGLYERGFKVGRRIAIADARRALAGEDGVEWARKARGSMVSLPHAMEILDDLSEDA